MDKGQVVYFPIVFVQTNEKREELLYKQIQINIYFKRLSERCDNDYDYAVEKQKIHKSLRDSLRLIKNENL